MSGSIKPPLECPFCGGVSSMFNVEVTDNGAAWQVWRACCTVAGCLAQGPIGGQGQIGRESAARKWNAARRAP